MRVDASILRQSARCRSLILNATVLSVSQRNLIRRGQVLVDPLVNPKSTRVFDAEVLILHHPTTIKLGYQAVLHCGMIRQTAQICRIQKECLRTGDKSICRFKFLLRDEFLHTGASLVPQCNQRRAMSCDLACVCVRSALESCCELTLPVLPRVAVFPCRLSAPLSFVFREGSTKGIGKVVRIAFTDAERAEMEAEDAARKKQGGGNRSQQPSTKDKVSVGAAHAAAAGGKTTAGNEGAEAEAGPSDVPASSSAASTADPSDDSGGASLGKQKWSSREKVEYQKERAKADGSGAGAAAKEHQHDPHAHKHAGASDKHPHAHAHDGAKHDKHDKHKK